MAGSHYYKLKPFRSKKSSPVIFMDVACAVIFQDGRVLITLRRKSDHLGGFWEFPGGKRLASESLGACLQREIWEELAIRIEPRRLLKKIDHLYPDRGVSLYFYECRLVEGRPWPRGSEEFRWVRPFELKHYPFPPADKGILDYLNLFLLPRV